MLEFLPNNNRMQLKISNYSYSYSWILLHTMDWTVPSSKIKLTMPCCDHYVQQQHKNNILICYHWRATKKFITQNDNSVLLQPHESIISCVSTTKLPHGSINIKMFQMCSVLWRRACIANKITNGSNIRRISCPNWFQVVFLPCPVFFECQNVNKP